MDGLHGMDRRWLLAGGMALAAGFGGEWALGVRRTTMGFSKQGLAALDAELDGHLATGHPPGLAALVRCVDETHVHVTGKMALDGPPLARDAIFRIASMTKPFTAAAAMMLVDEGRLRLDEPVERLLPELADRRVLRRIDGPLDDTVPTERAITVEDVLTFRLGWGVLFEEHYPISKAVAGLPGFGMPDPTWPHGPDEFMRRLADLPLMAQPGARWMYTVGSNVLGVLVGRAAGKPLDQVLAERIFAPLGLRDTAFHVGDDKRDRFVTGYFNEGGRLVPFDLPDGLFSRPPAFPAGDSGLVSTLDDMDAFARFLETGRTPGGARLLSEASTQAMKIDRLTAAQRADGELILGPGEGWGYGLGVYNDENPYGISPGAYGWNGGFGTSWFSDPSTGLTAILLTQRVFDGPDPPQVHKDFWRAAYGALA